ETVSRKNDFAVLPVGMPPVNLMYTVPPTKVSRLVVNCWKLVVRLDVPEGVLPEVWCVISVVQVLPSVLACTWTLSVEAQPDSFAYQMRSALVALVRLRVRVSVPVPCMRAWHGVPCGELDAVTTGRSVPVPPLVQPEPVQPEPWFQAPQV